MKFFAVFAAVLALSAAYEPISTWTMEEVTTALASPDTDPAIVPYLVDGLNQIMANLHAGDNHAAVIISVPVQESMTLDQLIAAVHDPNTNPALMPYYEEALMDLMVAMNNGQEEAAITLNIPAMQVNMWSLEQLSAALQNPETDPELEIYLQHALNELMTQMWAGTPVTSIAVITPPGIMAVAPAVPVPVIPEPVIPEPVIPVIPEPAIIDETIVAPEPAVVPEAIVASSSPLVQIIVNVNAQSQAAAATPAAVAPQPATDAEQILDIISPMPVIDGGHGIISPMPVVDGAQEIISPMPVVGGPEPVIAGGQTPIIAVGPWA